MATNEPKPMDPERLARARVHASPQTAIVVPEGVTELWRLLTELLADRDYQAARADQLRELLVGAEGDFEDATITGSKLAEKYRAAKAEVERQAARADAAERERDELLRAAANIGSEMPGMESDFGAMGTAGAVTRSAASLMVAAVRLHPKVETGIVCTVDVDGREMEVIAQWSDAPIRTNFVSAAADLAHAQADRDMFKNRAARYETVLAELPLDCQPEYDGAPAVTRLVARAKRTDAAEAEVTRLRARVRVEAADVERAGVTRAHVEAWLRSNGWTHRPNGDDPRGPEWQCGHFMVFADDDACEAVVAAAGERRAGRAGQWDILDEMAAMPVEPQPT